MKKLLGSTLALALFVPASANAELLKNLKVGGQLDVQTTSARNVTDFATRAGDATNTPNATNNDRVGSALSRLMVKLDWDLLDDVHAKVTLVKGGAQGTNNAALVDKTRPYGTAADNLTTIESNTYLQEAYVKIDKLFGFTDMTLGRQFYGESGDMVVYFGPRDNYGLTVTALDAARFDWNGESVSVTGVAGKISNGDILATANNDTDLRGLVVSCNKNENVKGSVYVYNAVQHSTSAGLGAADGKNSSLYVAGLKTELAFGGLMSSLELAKNFGSDRTGGSLNNSNYKGWAFLGKAAYKADLQDVGAITPWGEFAYATGDHNGAFEGNNTFTSIASDYRPGGIYGRFDSYSTVKLGSALSGGGGIATSFSNRIIWGVGVKATPAALSKLTAGVQFYAYKFHTIVSDLANSRSIGAETDVTAEWKHSENVSLKGTVGSFQPGQFVAQQQTTKNPAFMAALDFSVKF